ncbi:hypothetical protein ASPZODRAFT_57306 [Penicilliopsis zonata CBS 506.65]|uniref:Uncharacterized protein n=1 Tax=Penicilliopsis zonata CBS 506.65 TaxID=1073090 RepID=A0A1L9SWT8_9EURO|nr:hypothetical protein ASPZODRAFT_57306 [Penicilliopsis zonata CBS 506.65]OJJ51650.1 hypothetical protein ASPZODRAFT_57306 [Penicilliopsis zonata CBS 506.65]
MVLSNENEFVVQDTTFSSLHNAVVVLTGASSGIGRETALALHQHGAHVVFGDVDANGAAETLSMAEQQQNQLGGSVEYIQCDVSLYDDVYRLFSSALDKHGHVDHVVASAAIFNREKWIDPALSIEEVAKPNTKASKILDVDLVGTANTSRIAGPFLMANRKGDTEKKTLTLLGSVASMQQVGEAVMYQAAKHGVLGLLRAMRTPFYRHRIQVNCVCPDITLTPMAAPFMDSFKKNRAWTQTSEDVARVILGLLDSDIHGKSFYLGAGRAWEFEDGLSEAMPHWLGSEGSRHFKWNLECLAKVSPVPFSSHTFSNCFCQDH